jgi:hypothetical protein
VALEVVERQNDALAAAVDYVVGCLVGDDDRVDGALIRVDPGTTSGRRPDHRGTRHR